MENRYNDKGLIKSVESSLVVRGSFAGGLVRSAFSVFKRAIFRAIADGNERRARCF